MQAMITAGGGQSAIELLEENKAGKAKLLNRDTIDRCVNLGLRLGAGFGGLNSCLSRCTIRCILLRESGVPARVAFGMKKESGGLGGHCWVVEDGTPAEQPDNGSDHYDDIQYFPKT